MGTKSVPMKGYKWFHRAAPQGEPASRAMLKPKGLYTRPGYSLKGGRMLWTPRRWHVIATRRQNPSKRLCSDGWFHYYPTLQGALTQIQGDAPAYCQLPFAVPDAQGELWEVEVRGHVHIDHQHKKAGATELRPIRKVDVTALLGGPAGLKALMRAKDRWEANWLQMDTTEQFIKWLKRRKILPTEKPR